MIIQLSVLYKEAHDLLF